MLRPKNETEKELNRRSEYYSKLQVQCKNCGRKHIFPIWQDKTVCDWCGKIVYKNKQVEFKDKFFQESKKIKLKEKILK